jgi:hypothetical protein
MAIITLTSDWGDSDYYTAAVKGRILRELPDAIIVDITHQIPPFDSTRAAYILRNVYRNFPEGSVHIIGMNTEETIENPHLVVQYDGHYFIGADDGIFSLIFEKEYEKAVILDIPQENGLFSFSTRDRFAKAAIMLSQGTPIEKLGEAHRALIQKISFEPTSNKQGIRGMIIHVDPYENLITNISKKLFDDVIGAKPFELNIKRYNCKRISESYSDAGEGELLCLFGSNNLLQIALNRANAASLLGVNLKDSVHVVLIPEKEGHDRPPLF